MCQLVACNAGIFWRASAFSSILIKRAPSWIQTRTRLGERRKGVPGSRSEAERRVAANLFDRELIPHGKRLHLSSMGTSVFYIDIFSATERILKIRAERRPDPDRFLEYFQ